MKRCFIIAGPNGAGKTTFAKRFLPQQGQDNFINADLIAQGLSPFKPEKAAVEAGRIMLQKIDQAVSSGESFAFETTLSGRNYVRRILDWKMKGYLLIIYFLVLPKEDMAVERVRLRVQQGGHNVPEETIRQRFRRGRENFENIYKRLVDDWFLIDNTDEVPTLLEASK